ncbi:MAG: hypothetical protein HGJ94_18460 [Desulfosarcina sp.]|nr:hypothetical protein [Desulfosarcina sp.]
MSEQQAQFWTPREAMPQPKRQTNRTLIRSVSNSQHEILNWIQLLYCPGGFDLDCTYRIGGLYRNGVVTPRWKMDIAPRTRDTIPADVTALPFKSGSLKAIIFDPPFFAAGSTKSNLRMKYGGFKTMDALWDMYRLSLQEIYRVLRIGGVLVFKCQDSVYGRKQYLVHADIIKYAQSINFYAQDLFVSLASHVAIAWNHGRQVHARKFHCYFIVFEKKRRFIKTLD